MSAESLQQQFALAFQGQAPSLFLELAELLPSDKQRAALLAAAAQAGWAPQQQQQQNPIPNTAAASPAGHDGMTAGSSAADNENNKIGDMGNEPEQAGDGWKPLDRSRLAAAAASLPSGVVRLDCLSQPCHHAPNLFETLCTVHDW